MNVFVALVLLVVACIGNAEWLVVLINRRHSLRYKHQYLHRVRRLHDFGLVVFPLFALWVAFRTDGLLNGGSLNSIPVLARGIFYFAMLGFIPFLYGVLRWQLTVRPKRFSIQASRVIDLWKAAQTASDKQLITGDAPPLLSRFPWNQVYQLEINQKRIDLSSGAAATSVQVAHFSDLHYIGCPGKGFHEFVFDELANMKPDVFIFTGDLVDRPELLPWAVEGFEKLVQVAPVYFILGNHDWHLDYDHIRSRMVQTGAIDLGERCEVFETNDCRILLAGTEAPWIGDNPKVPADVDCDARILVSHSPDQRDYGITNGFQLMLCGHNHGGQVVLPVIGPVYSPSKYGVKYAGGCHEASGMLLHISRGVAAKDTLRWNCRPEISRLEIVIPNNSSESTPSIG